MGMGVFFEKESQIYGTRSAKKPSDAINRISISSASPVHSSESPGIPAMLRNGFLFERYRAMNNQTNSKMKVIDVILMIHVTFIVTWYH